MTDAKSVTPLYVEMLGLEIDPSGAFKIPGEGLYKWRQDTITYVIIGRCWAKRARTELENAMRDWDRDLGIKFIELDEERDADIVIALDWPDSLLSEHNLPKGTWTYVGTSAKNRKTKNQPTMHLMSPLNTKENRIQLRRFLGFVLGLVHEHHPFDYERIDLQKARQYYNYFGYKESRVEQMLQFWQILSSNHDRNHYDPQSIMHCPIPPEILREGMTLPERNTITDSDLQIARFFYPPDASGQFDYDQQELNLRRHAVRERL